VADVLAKKALRKGGRLIVIGPEENRTSHFADVFLQCKDGEQSRVVLALLREFVHEAKQEIENLPHLREALAAKAEALPTGIDPGDLRRAAGILAGSLLKMVVFNKDYRGLRVAGDERLFAEAAEALGCPILALREKSNMQGLLDMGASPRWLPGYLPVADKEAVADLEKEWCVSLREAGGADGDVADLLRKKKIKVAVVLGEDPLANPDLPRDLVEGLLAADFLVVGDLFMTDTACAAHAVLPLSSFAETSGTVTSQERRVQRLAQAMPPRAGMESWRILCEIGARMGYRFKMKYPGVAAVTEEIQRVVPLYSEVAVDSPEANGVWGLDRFRLPRVLFDYTRRGEPRPSVPTAPLDDVERRFARWFEEMDKTAREALAAAASPA
jgi:predicted molibdopterin-dependent oxidoreductase YjgC